jgi:hypothetical protein
MLCPVASVSAVRSTPVLPALARRHLAAGRLRAGREATGWAAGTPLWLIMLFDAERHPGWGGRSQAGENGGRR